MEIDSETCKHYDVDFHNDGEGHDDYIVHQCGHANGDGFCEGCGGDLFDCPLLDGEQPREPEPQPEPQHITPQYKASLVDGNMVVGHVDAVEPRTTFQEEFTRELVMERAEKLYTEGQRVFYMGIRVDETWTKEALIGLIQDLRERSDETC